MQPLLSSLSAGDCLVHRLRKEMYYMWINKNLVHQVGNQTKVILRYTVNQLSRCDILVISVLSQVTFLKIRRHFDWTKYDRHCEFCRAIFTLPYFGFTRCGFWILSVSDEELYKSLLAYYSTTVTCLFTIIHFKTHFR